MLSSTFDKKSKWASADRTIIVHQCAPCDLDDENNRLRLSPPTLPTSLRRGGHNDLLGST
jgi:hypothetical protein